MAQNLTYLLSERSRLLAEIARLNSQLDYAKANANQSIVAGIEARLASSQELLATVDEQLQQAQTDTSRPTGSAGEFVREEQQARAENAGVSNPVAPVTTVSDDAITLTDFQTQSLLVETGTDGRIRPLIETQATPPAGDGSPLPYIPYALPGDEDAGQNAFVLPPSPSLQAGAGAGSGGDDAAAGRVPLSGEDAALATKNTTRQSIDNTFNQGRIIPQPNILDQYGTYTYQASLYLMSPDDYKRLLESNKKIIPGKQLLMQSGGAPIAGRNTYFGNDYYIDKIVLRSAITGKGTNAAHNVNEVRITVIEPNGITLIPNLDKAVQEYLGSAQKKKTNFTAAIYLLVIRFYGYDDAGNLIRGGSPTGVQGTAGTGGAFVEKFYPIAISKIDFKVANKAVEYEISATAVQQFIATGSSRGTIPYNVEMGGITVNDALNGPSIVASPLRTGGFTPEELDRLARDNGVSAEGDEPPPPAPPPNAAAAVNPKGTVRQGLMAAINQFQQELVKKGTYTVADTYSVEFTDPALAQAKIQIKNPEKTATGSTPPTTANQKLNPATNSQDTKSRNLSVLAGTQIVQFIDQVMRNSTYITDQAIVTRSEQGTGRQVSNGKPGNNVASYKINMVVTPKKYDPKRNDYAYDIKYVVSPYKITGLISDYFQIPKFNGVHKQYNYWFTGENTQVLSYEQTYNALYTAVMSGGPGALGGTVVQDAIKANFQPTSGESSQGAKNAVNEIGANFTDYLYNPGDLANATIQIVGDPAWLQQSDVNPIGAGSFVPGPFLADGTINFDSQQILFEILINTPADYDLNTGIIDPNVRQTVFQDGRKPGAVRQSYVYIANDCVSEFNKGSFKQTLKGSLLTYFPDQTFKEQQALGRNTSTPFGNTRPSSNGTTPDNEWTDQNGLNVFTADLPGDNTDEDVPISLNDPQPQPDPEPVTSDADILYIESEGDPVLLNNQAEAVPEPDYNSGLAGTTSSSQLMDREA
jgi:hypothetical protein